MTLSNRQLETLTWVLIYTGLLLFGLGLFVWRLGDALFGGTLAAAGIVDTLAGVAMLWWRSRRPG